MKTNNQLINDMKDLFYFLEENFSENEIIEMYNEYADSVRCERLNDIENINKDLAGLDPDRIIYMVVYGEYHPGDRYYTFDGYGNIQTISENDIIEYIGGNVDGEEFYTFLIDQGFFTESEYKLYSNK